MIAASGLSAFIAYRVARPRGSLPHFSAAQSGKCYSIKEALPHSGEDGCVEGRVLRVYTARSGATFLDFCRDYRSCPFSSVVFASDRPRFGNLASITGRIVRLSGEITTYDGRAEIVLRDSTQIQNVQ